tara:strand:+ start:188 stop:643 length:456 start_codon:yes stop_codon:yes gene_type:complete
MRSGRDNYFSSSFFFFLLPIAFSKIPFKVAPDFVAPSPNLAIKDFSSSIKKIGHTKSIKDLVIKQASLAKKAKLDGIVCSGYEVKLIKKICKGMEIITPGIRIKGDSTGDQKRVMSPKEAFNNGATAIVMGRSITKGDIKRNIKRLNKSLK